MRCVVKIRTQQSVLPASEAFLEGIQLKSRNGINKDRVGEREPILRHPG